MQVTFTATRDKDSEFFRSLVTRHLNKNIDLTEEEQEIRRSTQVVMNSLEFIAIGILNRAIDEDIVKWSFEIMYTRLYDVLDGYIEVLRKSEGQEGTYINFTELVERWNPDKVKPAPETAKPTN